MSAMLPICPSCGIELKGKTSVEFRFPAFFQARPPEGTGDDSPKSKVFRCQACQAALQLSLKVEFMGVVEGEGSKKTPSRTDNELFVLKQATESGILNTFKETWGKIQTDRGIEIGDLSSSFLYFLKTATWFVVPRSLLEELKGKFGHKVKVYQAQGICVVLSSGKICAFTPISTFRPPRHSIHLGNVKLKNTGPSNLSDAFKTSFGYVPENTLLFLASLQQSLGHQGKEMPDTPLHKEDKG